MDILVALISMLLLLGVVISLSPQWLRWSSARLLARAEGLEAQRLHRDKALAKWTIELDVKPIRTSKLVELPSRSLE